MHTPASTIPEDALKPETTAVCQVFSDSSLNKTVRKLRRISADCEKGRFQRVHVRSTAIHSLSAQCDEVHLIDPFVGRSAERVQIELDVDARVVAPTRWKRRGRSNQFDLGVDVIDA